MIAAQHAVDSAKRIIGLTLPRERLDFACTNAALNLRPLFVAMRDQGLGLLTINHGGGFEILHRGDVVGTVALVGDDLPGGGTAGPSGFNQELISRLLNSENAVVYVYSAAANVGHYHSFAAMALAGAIVTVIETQPDREAGWLHFISKASPGTAVIVVTSRPVTEHTVGEARA